MADMFALTKSGLGNFLYARVGEELNGSELTILSMLARVGRDPWEAAASWAQGSRATAIDELAGDIERAALREPTAQSARERASLLLKLLPRASGPLAGGRDPGPKLRRWPFMLTAALGFALSLAAPTIIRTCLPHLSSAIEAQPPHPWR